MIWVFIIAGTTLVLLLVLNTLYGRVIHIKGGKTYIKKNLHEHLPETSIDIPDGCLEELARYAKDDVGELADILLRIDKKADYKKKMDLIIHSLIHRIVPKKKRLNPIGGEISLPEVDQILDKYNVSW